MVVSEKNVSLGDRSSSVQMPVEQIERIPAILGEPDVLKALTLLPGVSGGTEGSANIFVRGGTPDQNLILLDGAPVYNVNHLFGFLSLFNTDAIRHVELFKSEFPARYGGRLSSVLKVDMKEGSRERFNARLSVGIVSSRLMLDGPIGRSKRTSFLLAARTSYLDLFTLPARFGFENGGNEFFNYNLYDLNAKVSHTFNDKHRMFLSFYGGSDRFQENFREVSGTEKSNLQWGNQTVTLRSARQLGQKAFLNSSLIYSRYGYEQSNETTRAELGTVDQYYEATSGLRSFSLRQTVEYAPIPAHQLTAGYELTNYRFTPQANEFRATGQPDYFFEQQLEANAVSVFAEDHLRLTPFWNWRLGLRWSQYFIDDRNYQFWEPRIASSIRLPWGVECIQSINWMHQPIHLLTNSGVGLPNDIWVPATANTPPQQARQWGTGLSRYFPRIGLEASVEYYQKYSRNLIDYREGSSFLSTIDQNWETVIARDGEGWSRGLELLLHKKVGRLNGLLSYTLSRHERRFDAINSGQRFPFQFDRRHDFSTALNYQINDGWTASATFIYHTGNAITLPTEKYPVPDELTPFTGGYVFTYGERNAYRLPDYHRVDLGFAHRKPKGQFGSREWRFGIYNLYNRENTYYIQPVNVAERDPNDFSNVLDWDVQLRNRYLIGILPYLSYTRSW